MSVAQLRTSLGLPSVLTAAYSRWRAHIPAFALLGLFAYFSLLVITRIFFTSPGYDDSYIGSVARNFAFGRGYATAYGETIAIFGPGITTGPAVVVPAAVLYRIFGNHYWVGNLVVPLIALPLLAALLWVLYSRLKLSLWTSLVILVALIVFTNERTADGEVFRPAFLWAHMMGEIPAVLWMTLAAALACTARSNPRLHLLAGACLALALYSKPQILTAVPGFCIVYAWQFVHDRRPVTLLAVAGGALAMASVFELFRLQHLGSWHNYVQNTRETYDYYRYWSSVGGTDYSTLHALLDETNLTLGVIPLLLLVGVLVVAGFRRLPSGAIERARLQLAVILLLAAAINFYWWWIENNTGFLRYLAPAIVSLAVGVPVLTTMSRTPLLRYAALGVFGLLLAPQLADIGQFTPMTHTESRLNSLQNTAAYLNSVESPAVSLWGCGWWANRDLHLVGDLRFYDCDDQASVAKHLRAGEQLLLVRSEYFNWENNPNFSALAQRCDTGKLFADGPFVVCDATPWLKAAAVSGP